VIGGAAGVGGDAAPPVAQDDAAPDGPVDAGEFGAWLQSILASFRGRGGSDVPCGSCRACCTSSQFILVRPQDRAALAAIPATLLVKAPFGETGARVMGFGDDGACPMMHARECTIYASRPQTCRDYDCRVFAAAGIDAGGARKSDINARVRVWRFSYATAQALEQHEAVRAAAHFIAAHPGAFPGGRAPLAPSGIAVLALQAHTVFLQPHDAARSATEIATAIARARRRFPD
jgi:hypothetical protein